MSRYSVVVIGGSAGAITALRRLVARLPSDFPVPIAVTVHMAANARSVLPAILANAGPLDAVHAREGQPLEPGTIYVAPPDLHLRVPDGTAEVRRGPKLNMHRPAIDVLFESAAEWHRERAIGVLLSGYLDDGTAGMAAIAEAGGVTIVQDLEDAMHRPMPQSAIDYGRPTYILPAPDIGDLLGRLASGDVDAPTGSNAADDVGLLLDPDAIISCPDCGGPMRPENGRHRFSCRVGHSFSLESLNTAQLERLEEALWLAIRALRERHDVSAALAERFEQRRRTMLGRHYRREARRADVMAERIQQALLELVEPPPVDDAEEAAAAGATGITE